jgi:sRNA-binding carbon storage regulator CsrA
MLVLSRRKHEAVLIDGVIRVEVLGLAKSMVRLRLIAPRDMPVVADIAKRELRPRNDPSSQNCGVGVRTSDLTLVTQQVIKLSESITFGVVDVDRSRALFFIDAPPGTSVTSLEQQDLRCTDSARSQPLLQFMGPGGETPECELGTPAPKTPPRDGHVENEPPTPTLLPFRLPRSQRHRS